MSRPGYLVALLLGALATPAQGEGVIRVRSVASAELLYNDGVELLFEESDRSAPSGGDAADTPTSTPRSLGLGADVDASAAIEAHPLAWLSLQVRPELFGQLFFDRKDTAVVRLSPPLFVQAELHPTLTLLFASEYVANFVPYRPTFTFHRETATTRLRWKPWSRLELDLQSIERIKRYPDRVTWSFRSHRFGAGVGVVIGPHLRLSAAYATQLNSGADSLGTVAGDEGGSTAEGWQQLLSAGARLGWGDHILEAGYQLRIARGGDALAAVDQPLLSPRGTIEEDIDELSLGGFAKQLVELTYDVRIGRRVVGDLYGRYSRKSFRELASTANPTQLRVDDVWLVGATLSVRLVRSLELDVRALYHVNDSSDPEYTFRNLILGLGLRWER